MCGFSKKCSSVNKTVQTFVEIVEKCDEKIWKKAAHGNNFVFITSSSSSSVQGSVFSRIDALQGGLKWEVESTTVTHSSADWWDLLLPLA